ncbi:MAG: hypothetical protein AAF959_08695, partial [Cyanobacteria bacterium P01_D01_bin.56]
DKSVVNIFASSRSNGLLTLMERFQLSSWVSECFKRIDELQRALQLDAHYSNLELCLNRVAKAESVPQQDNLIDIDLEQNQSPIQRRAAAIRRLRQRRHLKNRPGAGPVFPL